MWLSSHERARSMACTFTNGSGASAVRHSSNCARDVAQTRIRTETRGGSDVLRPSAAGGSLCGDASARGAEYSISKLGLASLAWMRTAEMARHGTATRGRARYARPV